MIHKGKPGAVTERFAAHSPGDLSVGLRGGGEQECCQQVPCTQQHRQGCPGQMARIGLREPLFPLRSAGEGVVSKHLSAPPTAKPSAWLLSLSKRSPANLG